MAIIMIAFFT